MSLHKSTQSADAPKAVRKSAPYWAGARNPLWVEAFAAEIRDKIALLLSLDYAKIYHDFDFDLTLPPRVRDGVLVLNTGGSVFETMTALHEFLDFKYGPDGDALLRESLAQGADCNAVVDGETPLHVAARRRRKSAVTILLDHGADIDAKNGDGKTAYAHALRRGFNEVSALLVERGADTAFTEADRLAVAVVNGRLGDARLLLTQHPDAVRTGNPEEDRLLADVSGRNDSQAVALLIEAGADLMAPGLDSGTPLHQAAWFGQPANARLLIDAGAPLDTFDHVHESSPLGWAVHGSRHSGGAEQRPGVYAELVQMLLEAGSSLHYPVDPGGHAYLTRLRNDATPEIRGLLPEIP